MGAITDAILLADRSVRLMQCGLVFFLLLFSEYLGISRRSLLFGISLGFGFFAAVNMLVATGMSHRGILRQATLSQINSAAYLFAIADLVGLHFCRGSFQEQAPGEGRGSIEGLELSFGRCSRAGRRRQPAGQHGPYRGAVAVSSRRIESQYHRRTQV